MYSILPLPRNFNVVTGLEEQATQAIVCLQGPRA